MRSGLILSRDASYLIIDLSNILNISPIRHNIKIIHQSSPFLIQDIHDLLKKRRIRKVGIDPFHFTYQDHLYLKSVNPEIKTVPISREISDIRSVKDAIEIQIIKKAAELTVSLFHRVESWVQIGMTEKKLQQLLVQEIIATDAEYSAFEPIVLYGRNTSKPHGRPSNVKLKNGDIVMVDFGVRKQGYHSDCTRTFSAYKSSARQKTIYKVVLDALNAGLEKVRPGIRCCDIDAAVRAVIRQQGFDCYFNYPAGHGIGLEIHEAPFMDPDNESPLKTGMVFTLEPGILIPGWGGIRLEEMVLVTATGMELLTKMNRDHLQLI